LRANRKALFVIASALLLGGATLSAHRLDEYLQAARIAVAPSRIDVELDLTPGVAIANDIITSIDRDGDGQLSADEQRAYAGQVLSETRLAIDDRPLRLELRGSIFPAIDAIRRGEGTIQLRAGAEVGGLADGVHHLGFRHADGHFNSVYLANALVPESDSIAIKAQRRDANQRTLTIDFALHNDSPFVPGRWPALCGGVSMLAALITRWLWSRPLATGPAEAGPHTARYRAG
jgi:hypothetical protein